MQTVLSAFAAALGDLRAPRILAVMLVPPLVALMAWGALAWFFADDWARWAAAWLASPWLAWIANWGLSSAFVWGSGILAFALMLPIVLVTALVVAEIIAMPLVVPWVERRFPGLERRKGGTVAGSVVNAVTTVLTFGLLWVVTLPLWFTGVGALVLPPVLSAYLNTRLFRYDALAEHASAGEYRAVLARAKGRMFVLGLMLAVLYYVPLVNLVAPVLSALAFTHLCLAELAALRQSRR